MLECSPRVQLECTRRDASHRMSSRLVLNEDLKNCFGKVKQYGGWIILLISMRYMCPPLCCVVPSPHSNARHDPHQPRATISRWTKIPMLLIGSGLTRRSSWKFASSYDYKAHYWSILYYPSLKLDRGRLDIKSLTPSRLHLPPSDSRHTARVTSMATTLP